MKMKRMFALLLAAVMLFGCALAEPEAVATYIDGTGARIEDKIPAGENLEIEKHSGYNNIVVAWNDGQTHDDQNLIDSTSDNAISLKDGEDQYSVTVNGNVAFSGSLGDAINTGNSFDANIYVNGNVSSTGTGGIIALNGKEDIESAIIVYGDVTLDADEYDATAIQVGNADVVVCGDVTATNSTEDPFFAVRAKSSGNAVITGDLTVSNFSKAVSLSDDGATVSDAHVEVSGNIENDTGDGIYLEIAGTSTVSIGGNVSGGKCGIFNKESEDNQVTVGGDVNGVYGILGNFSTGNQVTVGGDVNGGEMGIRLIGVDGDTISVEGDVSGDEDAIDVQDSQNVTIDVGGDVTGGVAGIEVMESTNTKVSVEGDVSGEVAALAIGNEGTTITIGGNATASWIGVETDNMTEIFIGNPEDDTTGNVTVTVKGEAMEALAGTGVGIVLLSDDPAEGIVQITGTVTGVGEAPALVVVDEGIGVTAENIAELLPEITVFELAPADGETFVSYAIQNNGPDMEVEKDQDSEIVKAIAEAIQYIVKIADDSKDKVTVSGTTTSSTGLTVAKENDKLQVQVAADDGMEIKSMTAGDYATVTKNGDGTWTITVVRGGGIVISATLAPVQAGSSLYDSIGQYYLYGKRLPEGANPETDEKEDLVWRCIGIYSGYAKLALVRGFEAIPEDFAESFTEEEMAGIKDGEIKELEPEKAERLFNDGLVHPVMLVDVYSLGIW